MRGVAELHDVCHVKLYRVLKKLEGKFLVQKKKGSIKCAMLIGLGHNPNDKIPNVHNPKLRLIILSDKKMHYKIDIYLYVTTLKYFCTWTSLGQ